MTRIALISDIHYGRFSRTAEFSVPGEKIIDDHYMRIRAASL